MACSNARSSHHATDASRRFWRDSGGGRARIRQPAGRSSKVVKRQDLADWQSRLPNSRRFLPKTPKVHPTRPAKPRSNRSHQTARRPLRIKRWLVLCVLTRVRKPAVSLVGPTPAKKFTGNGTRNLKMSDTRIQSASRIRIGSTRNRQPLPNMTAHLPR